METYQIDGEGRFVINGYNRAKPFSSFLPGIAGIHGKPMWLFYVNRGQGVASFGVKDKNGAIMEFHPAGRSYQTVPVQGFRTFIKLDDGIVYEPFSFQAGNRKAEEAMYVSPNKLELKSVHPSLGLEVDVTYFTLSNETFPALVRRVSIRNSSDSEKRLEVLDGMPSILPFGIENLPYKELGHTLKSWMDVFNRENGIPYYKLRASTADSVNVSEIKGGHFILGFTICEGKEELLEPIVDADVVFGANTTYSLPETFERLPLSGLNRIRQVTTNKVPCGFIGAERVLQAGESMELYMIIGHTAVIDSINSRVKELASRSYLERKQAEADAMAESVTKPIETQTSMPLFDAYCKQCYLDNVLRGGEPVLLGGGMESPHVYHIYSRKHGDLERDYNFFSLQPSYYSQGNGNFRDANQNRRSDVLFHPEVGDFNILMFMSLLQADGYNPLVVKGCSFKVRDSAFAASCAEGADLARLERYFESAFTPGDLLGFAEEQGLKLKVSTEELLHTALANSEQSFEAEFGEGYWIDHWTYNMDLIDSYLAVYPDRLEQLLFGNAQYTYFDSPAWVLPRERKHVLAGGKVRQYGSIEESEEKEHLIASRADRRNWLRVNHGKGDIYRTQLFEKLLALALVKLATLDPEGIGIEMEAGKPGWNDSLNGLPGLFASGVSELCELKRVLLFLLAAEGVGPVSVSVPVEIAGLLEETEKNLDLYRLDGDDFGYWNRSSMARELYRERIRLGFEGEMKILGRVKLEGVLRKALTKVEDGLLKALAIGGGVYPTYFYYEALDYVELSDGSGNPLVNGNGQPLVRVTGFKRVDLPYFLEGPTRAMKVTADRKQRIELHRKLRGTGVYDSVLKMYKVNASLEGLTHEIGRARAFTPGWLENESVFLHMEYKYLLELLKGGLHEEFFEDMRNAMVPFLDPAVYGRSTLENSSFIASGANPDPSLHGNGFVARLSGSTAEFLSMWNVMMWGAHPFKMEQGQLCWKPAPVLPDWMFNKSNEIHAVFLGEIEAVYHNPGRKNTFGENAATVRSVTLTFDDGRTEKVVGDTVREPFASAVRSKQVKRMQLELG
jgi:hypothetical protein